MTTSSKSAPGRHRKNQPPNWVGVTPFRWHLITLFIILLVLTLGGLL